MSACISPSQLFRSGFLFVLVFCSGLAVARDAAVLTAPHQLSSGGLSSFTLTTFDSEGQLPIDRSVTVRLVSSDGAQTVFLYSGSTGSIGQVRSSFQVPEDFPESVVIEAVVAGISAPLRISSQIQKNVAVLIETDKPIYKPGQKILGRVVLLNSVLHPALGEIELSVHDAKGLRIARRNLVANRFGVAAFDLDLAGELNEGTWKLRAKSGSSEAVRDVRVEKYTLPKFELGIDLQKSWALVDEAISGSVNAAYFFGKQVDGSVVLSAKKWIGVWEEYARQEGELTDGEWAFRLPAAGFVTGTAGGSGQGLVTLEVEVTDQAGDQLSTTSIVTISAAPVVLSLIPASESVKPGIPGHIFVQSKVPDGTFRDSVVSTITRFYSWDGTLLDEVSREISTENGVGTLEFTAPDNTAWVGVEGTTKVDGYTARSNVRVGSAFSPSGSFIAVTDLGDAIKQVGQPATFKVVSAGRGTVYYEVYAGGRTVLSDATESDSFTVNIGPEMVPRAKVIAYMIAENNEISADSVAFDVALPVSVQMVAQFGEDLVKPGDKVELVLDAGTGQETMLGISIVDESVLALGRSRLHLREVFDQLEKTFLEPLVEVHEGGNGDPLPGIGPWAPIQTPGAAEVFSDLGLKIAVSEGVLVPSGGRLDWFDVEVPVSGGGAGRADDPSELPRLRQYFPETWIWEPMLLTDEKGRVQMELTAPDSITGWKLQIVGTTPGVSVESPGIGFGDSELTVFQDFFVEPTLPVSLVRGEKISLRTSVFNYLDRSQQVKLTIEPASGVELLGEEETTVNVPANSVSAVYFDLRPTEVGEHPLRLIALGELAGDAVERPLRVIPEGRPVESIANGVLVPGEETPIEVSFPPEAIRDSARAFLYLSPSPVAQTMEGVGDLLGMPYGCGEQNMIFLAPDVEILKYLRELDELAPEIRAKAEYYINVGYQRQLTYQTEDGGFAAFGGPEGSLWLTAFVLSTFASAREVRDIDEAVMDRAAQMLLSRQLSDGSFETDDFLIHQEMDGGVENLFAMTAYVANALADYGSADVAGALSAAADYLIEALDRVWDDPYSLAIAAVTFQKVAGFEDVADQTIARLLELAVDDRSGLHWEPYPVETTGYVVLALLGSSDALHLQAASRGVDWLSTQRNSLGGYGTSTQDTVLAMKAMFQAARKAHREIDLRVSLWQKETMLLESHIGRENFDVLQQFEIPSGAELLTLRSEGSGNIAFQVAQRFNVPGDFLPPPQNVEFLVEYSAAHVEVDDLVDVRVSVRYIGEKERTGMVIIDIGVPTGFEPVVDTLKALEEREIIERSEIAGRKVILYLDGLDREKQISFSFQVRALYPIEAEGTVSQVYEYYDPDVLAFSAQSGMLVDEKPRVPEIDTLSRREGSPGERLIIRGSGFSEGIIGIWVGDRLVTDFEVIDDTTLQIILPLLPEGEVDLRIETQDGRVTLAGLDSGLTVRTRTLYFPIYRSRGVEFTGFALSNLEDQTVPVRFTAFRGVDGQLAAWPLNPSNLSISPGQQFARLGEEVFQHQEDAEGITWVRVDSNSPGVAGCSLVGNGQALDGAEASLGPAQRLYFPTVVQGDSLVWGPAAQTTINIANPNADFVEVELIFRPDDNRNRRTFRSVHRLESLSMLQGSISELVPGLTAPSSGYLEVAVQQGGGVVAAGTLELDEGRTLLNLAASEVGPSPNRYAAYVAEGPGVSTRLRLVNTAQSRRTMDVSVLGPEGSVEAGPFQLVLEAGASFDGSLRDLFQEVDDGLIAGALKVVPRGGGVLGDVIWVERHAQRFGAAMRLRDAGTRRGVFTHVATVGDLFTGLGLFNPGQVSSAVAIQVFDREGRSVGSNSIELASGHSLTRLIGELVPESRDLVQGYILVEASESLIIQESFGDRRGRFLAAIAPSLTGF